jgi:pimeloyl-ACP methyl ester carboxylesterase
VRTTLTATSVAFALACGCAGASSAFEGSALPETDIAHADYGNPSLWLCRPGLAANKCEVNLDATVIDTNGDATIEAFRPAANPKVDCFYVYPTVSLDPGWYSDWKADQMEAGVVQLQFARFASVCQLYAPIYRQTTLTALRSAGGGRQPTGERLPDGVGGYQDVVDAWNWYLSHENDGRGVILLGHSQGARVISRLLANEIEGKPAQTRLVSAMIIGSTVLVPPGQATGGSFRSIPLCTAEDQIGCVITYATYRDTRPPAASARFAKEKDGMLAACTNPASLAGGKGTTQAYFLAQGFLNGSGGKLQPAWADPEPVIVTPFVTTPGLVSTRCTTRAEFSYLELQVNADPADPRTDQLAGEIVRANGPDHDWGLHLIDIDHSMGDLLRIAGRQADAWLARQQGLPAD